LADHENDRLRIFTFSSWSVHEIGLEYLFTDWHNKVNKKRVLIITLVVLGILLAAFFGMRAIHSFRRIHEGGFGPGHRLPPPSQTDVELIRDWMTIPYIAMTYGVPDRMLFRELGIPDKNNRDKNLKDLNNRYYPNDDGYVLQRVKQAILSHRLRQPIPSPTP
jgi:hypothetical protein